MGRHTTYWGYLSQVDTPTTGFWKEREERLVHKLWYQVDVKALSQALNSFSTKVVKHPRGKMGNIHREGDKTSSDHSEITSETTPERGRGEEELPAKDNAPESNRELETERDVILWMKDVWGRRMNVLGMRSKARWSRNIREEQFRKADSAEFRREFLDYLEACDDPHPVDFAINRSAERAVLVKNRRGRNREHQMGTRSEQLERMKSWKGVTWTA